MTQFINLTPHVLRLRPNLTNPTPEPDSTDIVVESTGVARVAMKQGEQLGEAAGIGLYGRTVYGVPEGIPEPVPGTIYLVSVLFAGRVGDRDDVFIPATGPRDGAVRDGGGQVYAVTRLVQA